MAISRSVVAPIDRGHAPRCSTARCQPDAHQPEQVGAPDSSGACSFAGWWSSRSQEAMCDFVSWSIGLIFLATGGLGVRLTMTARNMATTCWAVVADHFHGFGIGEADWFLDGFPTVRAPLRALAPIAIVERPEAYRAACSAILGSRTRRGSSTVASCTLRAGWGAVQS